MKVLITGSTGFLGKILCDYFSREHRVFGVSNDCQPGDSSIVCDLRDSSAVAKLAAAVRPDVVVHAAGLKDIALCEKDESMAMAVNAQATENVSAAFSRSSKVIYISTDYVFDGKRGGYSEDEEPSPGTIYGKTKLAGERRGAAAGGKNFFIVRTAAVYNGAAKFISYLRENLEKGASVQCYPDVFYSPTFHSDLTSGLEAIALGTPARQVFHLCGPRISRFGFAMLAANLLGAADELVKPALKPASDWHLMPDLSMDVSATKTVLMSAQTPHKTALASIFAKEHSR